LSRKAKIYIFLNATLGVWILGAAMARARPEDSLRYLCYLVGAVITSHLKVRLPGITGTMSVNFFFILIAIIELDRPQVLAIACAGTLGQMLWHASKKPRPVQMVFNLSSIVIASSAAYALFHWRVLGLLDGSLPLRLFVATGAFFFINTVTVSAVIALTEAKSLWSIWRESFVWTSTQYMVGAALAGLVHTLSRHLGWQVALLALRSAECCDSDASRKPDSP